MICFKLCYNVWMIFMILCQHNAAKPLFFIFFFCCSAFLTVFNKIKKKCNKKIKLIFLKVKTFVIRSQFTEIIRVSQSEAKQRLGILEWMVFNIFCIVQWLYHFVDITILWCRSSTNTVRTSVGIGRWVRWNL